MSKNDEKSMDVETGKVAVNQLCPWSGDPVSSDSLTEYQGHVVGFCNTGCRDKFVVATSCFDAAISKLAAIERDEDIELNALADARGGQIVHMVRLDEL